MGSIDFYHSLTNQGRCFVEKNWTCFAKLSAKNNHKVNIRSKVTEKNEVPAVALHWKFPMATKPVEASHKFGFFELQKLQHFLPGLLLFRALSDIFFSFTCMPLQASLHFTLISAAKKSQRHKKFHKNFFGECWELNQGVRSKNTTSVPVRYLNEVFIAFYSILTTYAP